MGRAENDSTSFIIILYTRPLPPRASGGPGAGSSLDDSGGTETGAGA
jgi:hypothetical protein